MSILGREAELEQIREVLASSTKGRAARAIRIVGPSGIGKTALLQTTLGEAEAQWLTGVVTSHHIQSSLPLFAARRVAQALLERLGPQAERYSSGLDLGREQPEVFEESFFRVLEGISLDHAILLAFDDAQWADRESRALVERSVRALADRSIVLISTERSEDAGNAAFDFRDEAVLLHELSDAASATIARSIYPEANDEIVEAIVSRATGRVVDVIALSKGARDQSASTARDVDISLRRTIARELALLDAQLREFLQICSLIEDPIEYGILRGLWSEDRVMSFVASASGRFLTERGDGLHFVHDAIKQSVRETIAIAIPLHRRIIAAIQARSSLRYEDYERIIEQASACGDRDLQRATLIALAEEAFANSIFSLAASAWERAVAIAAPAGDDVIQFYTRLSLTYNATGREPENVRICNAALEAAHNAGITTGIGQLVSSLALAQSFCGNAAGARADLARYDALLVTPADRGQALTARAVIALNEGAVDEAQSALRQFAAIEDDAHATTRVRAHTLRAFIASRIGEPGEALAAIRAAEDATSGLPPIIKIMPLVASTLHTFNYGGPAKIDALLARRQDEQALNVFDALRILTHLARGEFGDARVAGTEALVRQRGVYARRFLLGLRAATAAFGSDNQSDGIWDEILGEVAAFQTGDDSATLVPIVSAWLVRESASNPRRAQTFLRRVLARIGRDAQPMVFNFPVLLAMAAKTANDSEILETIAAENSLGMGREPWTQAQNVLARGVASAFLSKPGAQALLNDASERFTLLGAPHFASLPALYLSSKSHDTTADGRFGATTRREREIADLVAQGLSNREIAQKLVLSERTIEGHIANLFNKLEVGSRTQVAAWYLRATSSVA